MTDGHFYRDLTIGRVRGRTVLMATADDDSVWVVPFDSDTEQHRHDRPVLFSSEQLCFLENMLSSLDCLAGRRLIDEPHWRSLEDERLAKHAVPASKTVQ